MGTDGAVDEADQDACLYAVTVHQGYKQQTDE